MTSNKTLIIPNYVTEQDIPKIWHYLDYYNIAKVDDIKYYYDHDDDGFAIIYIDEWYNNTGANNFYYSIVANKCRMVYDDPYYWNVEFYKYPHEHEHEHEHEHVANHEHVAEHEAKHEHVAEHVAEHEHQHEHEDDDDDVDEDEDEDTVDKYNLANQDLNESDNESYYDYESESETDDVKDLDYEFKETDEELDQYYEYYDSYHMRVKNKVKTVKKQKTNKKSESNDKNVVNLSDQLVKKNKNYLKNNKTKSFKNEWSRRLRRKVE